MLIVVVCDVWCAVLCCAAVQSRDVVACMTERAVALRLHWDVGVFPSAAVVLLAVFGASTAIE